MPIILSTPPQWGRRQCGRGPRQGEQKQWSLRAGPQQGAGNFKFWILWLVIFHEIHHFIFRCWHFQLLWSDVTKPPFVLENAFNVIPSWYHQHPWPAVPPYPTSPILILIVESCNPLEIFSEFLSSTLECSGLVRSVGHQFLTIQTIEKYCTAVHFQKKTLYRSMHWVIFTWYFGSAEERNSSSWNGNDVEYRVRQYY